MKKAKAQRGKGNWLVLPDGITYQIPVSHVVNRPKKTKKKRLRAWVWVAMLLGVYFFAMWYTSF